MVVEEVEMYKYLTRERKKNECPKPSFDSERENANFTVPHIKTLLKLTNEFATNEPE